MAEITHLLGVRTEDHCRSAPEVCSTQLPHEHGRSKLARQAIGKDNAGVVVALHRSEDAFASVLAVARAFREYTARSGDTDFQEVFVAAVHHNNPLEDGRFQPGIDGVRYAARLVDMPPSVLHSDAFVNEARSVAERVGADLQIIQGKDLERQGFGGIWGVGKAASRLPAMAVLTHNPEGATRSIAWIGKGIVYDTGGLSIKGKEHMPGMKADMGGAAHPRGFEATVKGCLHKLTAVLCIAENAVGRRRPDRMTSTGCTRASRWKSTTPMPKAAWSWQTE